MAAARKFEGGAPEKKQQKSAGEYRGPPKPESCGTFRGLPCGMFYFSYFKLTQPFLPALHSYIY